MRSVGTSGPGVAAAGADEEEEPKRSVGTSGPGVAAAGADDGTFNVFVELANKTVCLQVEGTDTAATLKAMIQAKEYISRDELDLVFDGYDLEDKKTVEFYEMKPNSTIRRRQGLQGGVRVVKKILKTKTTETVADHDRNIFETGDLKSVEIFSKK